MSVLAGTDFFSVEVLTLRGLVTYYVLFFIHLESRKVEIAGVTPHPNEAWMTQIARNVTMDEWGFLGNCRYLIPGEAGQALHDRDTKYCQSFRDIIESGDVKALRHTLREYLAHYNAERNHQGRGNILLFPSPATNSNRCNNPTIHSRERLGGLLKYYHLEAA